MLHFPWIFKFQPSRFQIEHSRHTKWGGNSKARSHWIFPGVNATLSDWT